GQIVQDTMNGTSGQLLKATMSGFTTSVSGASLTIEMVRSNGMPVASGTFTASMTTPTPLVVNLPSLPATGSYTVRIRPANNGSAGMTTTFSGQVLISPR